MGATTFYLLEKERKERLEKEKVVSKEQFNDTAVKKKEQPKRTSKSKSKESE
ncbi:hypothetical protein [Ureibacillus thermophilus]|uniref:hypothetical protein n=1 Tax=Ureibacillus thermophilus TaxID=367743 RepID=UPI001ABF5C62|nr:hypothetical protein [Ureibacillus thermophilus]